MAVAINNKVAQKQSSSEQTKIQTKIKVRYYEGRNSIVTLYMPSGEKIKVTEYRRERTKWLEPLIEWVKKNGRHKIERRKGYSSWARMHVLYSDDVWVAEIDADELLKLVTSHETWTRSRYAKEIVEKVSQMLKH
jgi:hypothetical protein